jgi:hypothetical protein
MSLLRKISNDLNVPESMLTEALTQSRKQVKHIKILKNDGSIRLVYQPSKKLKIIQYWLDSHIFRSFKIHESATAYQKEKSIKENVYIHRDNRYFLKLDFKEFFPSIKFNDFATFLKKWHESNNPSYSKDDLLNIVRHACFYLGDSLPIGYPTSPIISNIIMYEFDSQIKALISEQDIYGNCIYTRYADDLTFSTNLKGACKKIKILVSKELNSMVSPNLRLNTKKTKFVSSSGGSSLITGLRICHDGHITIHRKYKDRIRLLISLYQKGALPEKDKKSLKGHLAYIRNVDSFFYTKLQKKYFIAINQLLKEPSSNKANASSVKRSAAD